MAQVTYRGVQYDTNERKQVKSQKVQETYRGVKFEKELTAAQLQLNKFERRVLLPSFFCVIINKMKILMDRQQLKLIVRNLELLVDSLKSEVYSDIDAYKQANYDEHVGSIANYDEVFEDDE